jgi:hypothetical protein
MRTTANDNRKPRRLSRNLRTWSAILALAGTPALLDMQCGDDATKAFKQSAFPQLQTGVKAFLDGLVTGVFTINTPSSTSSNSTSSATGG